MTKRNHTIVFSVFAMLCFVWSCKKDEPPKIISYAPTVLFWSVKPATVVEYQDSITFRIAYRDTNGDLGENNPSVNNLFIIDNRINITYPFRIPQLAPDDANITIGGFLDVVLPNTGITDNSASQTAVFTIYVKDREGNESNRVDSDPVTLVK